MTKHRSVREQHCSIAQAVHSALGSGSASVLVLTASLVAATAVAQEQTDTAPSDDVLGAVTVTGSRIVRDGYEAPTPVTVIGVEQIQQAPQQHISDFVNRLPAFGGGMSTTSGGNEISTGRQSQNNLNLRGLDVFRTLVLLDGNRIVAGDVNGAVNINDLPQSLISRVDVITGGASAAYGSDALAGVVNFVLDKDFEGLKTDLQGGTTTHGDNDSYKANITFGTQFAGDRGHFIASGEYARNDGVFGALASRDWGFETRHIIANPAYGTGPGQATNVPQFLVASQAATRLAAPGGIITSLPTGSTAAQRAALLGWEFEADGTPRQHQFGPGANNQFNVGGDWRRTDVNYYNQTLANRLERQNLFVRADYDVTDDVNVFVNVIASKSTGFARSKLDDSLNNITIRRDNPFLHPSIAAQMDSVGATAFSMGSFNLDLPFITTNNIREMTSFAAGAEGAFGDGWSWNVYGQLGNVKSDINGRVMNRANFARATDAVRNSSGQIVCRVNADAATANDDPACVAWNPFGYGQNGIDAVRYSKGLAELDQKTTQSVLTAGVAGDPFNSWAGPVSVAAGVEWREEKVKGVPDPLSLQTAYTAGNYKGTNGKYDVTEAYVETLVPLARDAAWARSLDFNAAVRGTEYSTSGYVTTYKAGVTYNPIDDVRLRVTRSRDIRAPNLGEMFAAGTGGQSPGVLDPWNNNAPLPTFQNQNIGNPELQPEKADTTGIGIVFTPSFFDGFQASVDYYDINLEGAINSVGAQETLNRCFLGQQNYCNNIIRNGAGVITMVTSLPINVSSLHEQGFDIEASYTRTLGAGDLSLRALGTHVAYLKVDDQVNPVQDFAGDNANTGPLNWRWLLSSEYSVGPVTLAWTGRFMSAGHYAPTYVECKSNCPVSTPQRQTIDDNHIPSRFYHDLSFSYEFQAFGGSTGQAYLSVANVLDKQPPAIASAAYWYMPTNPQLYDTLGRQFFAGVRLKM